MPWEDKASVDIFEITTALPFILVLKGRTGELKICTGVNGLLRQKDWVPVYHQSILPHAVLDDQQDLHSTRQSDVIPGLGFDNVQRPAPQVAFDQIAKILISVPV